MYKQFAYASAIDAWLKDDEAEEEEVPDPEVPTFDRFVSTIAVWTCNRESAREWAERPRREIQIKDKTNEQKRHPPPPDGARKG